MHKSKRVRVAPLTPDDRNRQTKSKSNTNDESINNQEEAQANPPNDVKIDDWKNWCKHFESDKFQENIQENIENHSEELDVEHVEPVEPAEMKLYYDAHHKKDGTWVNQQAEENYEKMKTILSEEIEKGIEVNGRQILEKVLNVKYGYTRGLGHGVKPSSSVELELESALNAERVENEKRTQELVVQLQSQNDKILDQNATINELKKNQDVLQSQIQQLLTRFGENTST
ncbi:hypothetical protein V6N11_082494 [Hibiscus sabdariffa]|uniref:Transposase n=1 Tax=Hibiscus sabdariffa TaxID=183260 RepID=A0ABR2PDH9_9ROSI